MLSNCCGCCKEKEEQRFTMTNKVEKDGLTASNLLNSNEKNEDYDTETKIQEPKLTPIKGIMKRKSLTETITNQPKINLDIKRHSVHIYPVEEPDDDVFEDGVTSSANVSKNLGISQQDPTEQVNLPQWFSDKGQSKQLEGGTYEPPTTPIGKDELALKRHRFFLELLDAARNTEEPRVRFDPLGPVVAGVSDGLFCHQLNSDLESLVNRLENVVVKLEKTCLPIQTLSADIHTQTELQRSSDKFCSVVGNSLYSEMSIQGFQNIIQGPLAQYLKISQQIGGDVAEQSKFVKYAFEAQLEYLNFASQHKQPPQADQITYLQPTSKQISNIQEFREKHRTSPFFNHLSSISESIPALGWVTISPAPAPYIKEMNDAGQFYTNRVLKDWKEKDKKHVDWVKAWIETLNELQAFVKQHHTTGLVWSGKIGAPSGGPAIPPPPPGCPPPPNFADFSAPGDMGVDRSALFSEINQGENITKTLKKVTSEMQTHKNPNLRQGPVPFKPPSNVSTIGSKPAAPVDKPPVFARDGKKWLIEYQKNNHNLVVDNVEMNNVVYLFKCENSTVTVKGKLNSIVLDSCKKTSIVFDTLVSALEFINCQSVQMQVFGKVATISIDKTDGCQMYLNNNSLDVEIVSSKSSEMNVLVPKGNGDFTEYPIPEQYKTTIVPGRGLNTIVIESKG